MTKKFVIALAVMTLFFGVSGALPQSSQPQPPALAGHHADTGTKPGLLPEPVPSPAQYPFAEALRQLQNSDAALPMKEAPTTDMSKNDTPTKETPGKEMKEPAAMPPLKLVPLPPLEPRSTAIPRNYAPKKDVRLGPTGQEAVSVSQHWQEAANIPAPGKDGRVVYVYGAGMPVVVCAPLHICIVELEPGEKVLGEPQIGDSVRWEISPATAGSGEMAMSLIVIKPTAIGLDTTMMIPTDRRAYYLRLQSKPDDYLARVAFSYPEEQTQQWREFQRQQTAAHPAAELSLQEEAKDKTMPHKTLPDAVDSLYWDYSIKGGDPTMRPTHVLDDGLKTYIQMPAATGRTEAPVLVVEGPDGGEMVNYRVKEGVYIVDRLFNRAALIVGVGKHAKKVEITRKVQVGRNEERDSDKTGKEKQGEKAGGL